jgi:hypothetical protein
VHSGEADTPKQDAKYAFLEGMDARMRALARRASKDGIEALVCGDLNIAHREVDIKNWKGNLKSAGSYRRSAHISIDGSHVRGGISDGNSVGPGRVPTPGGPGGGRPSTTTPAGGSTITWPPPASRIGQPG